MRPLTPLQKKTLRFLDELTGKWETAREISSRTNLNHHQVGIMCRMLIKKGLVESRPTRRRYGRIRQVTEYRKTQEES